MEAKKPRNDGDVDDDGGHSLYDDDDDDDDDDDEVAEICYR